MTKDLIFLNVDNITSFEEALTYLGNQFVKLNVAKEAFPQALIEREKRFPTGLQFSNYGVAIPHTDVDYVNQTKVGIMTLKKPVEFIQMATTNQKVNVTLIVMLAIKEAHAQVDMLQKLIGLLQDEVFVQTILKSSDDDKERVFNLLKENAII